MTCGKRDTCLVHVDDLAPTSATSWNYWGVSIDNNEMHPRFVGSFIIQSLGGQAFYTASPNIWKVTGTGNSLCNKPSSAFYNAWQNTSWQDVFWLDPASGALVSSYGNYWHNDPWWDKGWNTTLFITNNSSSDVNVELYYITDGQPNELPSSLDPAPPPPRPPCDTTWLNDHEIRTIPALTTVEVYLNVLMGVPTTHTAGEDGFFHFWSTSGPSSVLQGSYAVNPYTITPDPRCGGGGCPTGQCATP